MTAPGPSCIQAPTQSTVAPKYNIKPQSCRSQTHYIFQYPHGSYTHRFLRLSEFNTFARGLSNSLLVRWNYSPTCVFAGYSRQPAALSGCTFYYSTEFSAAIHRRHKRTKSVGVHRKYFFLIVPKLMPNWKHTGQQFPESVIEDV